MSTFTQVALEEGAAPSSSNRLTVFLPNALLSNLEILALQQRKSKGVIVREALMKHLVNNQLDPSQEPEELTVKYRTASTGI